MVNMPQVSWKEGVAVLLLAFGFHYLTTRINDVENEIHKQAFRWEKELSNIVTTQGNKLSSRIDSLQAKVMSLEYDQQTQLGLLNTDVDRKISSVMMELQSNHEEELQSIHEMQSIHEEELQSIHEEHNYFMMEMRNMADKLSKRQRNKDLSIGDVLQYLVKTFSGFWSRVSGLLE